MVREVWGGDSKERGYRNYYKEHMDKIKGECGDGGREGVSAGVGCSDGEKRHTTVIE